MLLYSIPQKDKIADIRLSFINKDYSNVIEKSKESVPEVDYSKNKVEYELNMDERDI